MKFNLIKYQESLLLKENINLLQLRILIYLSHWMGKNNFVWPSNEMILSAMPSTSLDSIKKRIKELDKKGYIEREMVGKKRRIYLLDIETGTRFDTLEPQNKADQVEGTSQVPHQNIEGDLPSPPKGTHQVPPLPIYIKNKEKNDDVVVSFLDKYGIRRDPELMELISCYDDDRIKTLCEYTKSNAKTNPVAYMITLVKNKIDIPQIIDPYAADRLRLKTAWAETVESQKALGRRL